jgi:hypothetical protein
MIQTSSGGKLEIRLFPDNTQVLIGENTSFAYNGVDDKSGAVSLKILYGRVRIKNGGFTGREIAVQAGNGVVFFQEGDIGIDFMVQPSASQRGATYNQPFLKAYGFSGKSTMTLLNVEANIPRVPVTEFEIVSLELFTPLFLIERKPLDAESLGFWNKNNYKDAPGISLPSVSHTESAAVFPSVPVEAGVPSVPQIKYIEPDYAPYYKATRIKNMAIIIGSLFLAGGGTIEALGSYYAANGDPDLGKTMTSVGIGPMGLGLTALLGAILYNPKFVPPRKD